MWNTSETRHHMYAILYWDFNSVNLLFFENFNFCYVVWLFCGTLQQSNKPLSLLLENENVCNLQLENASMA